MPAGSRHAIARRAAAPIRGGASGSSLANLIGVIHGPAAVPGKSIAVHPDDVDVRSATREAFVQDSGAFVHDRQHAPLDDLGVVRSAAAADVAAFDASTMSDFRLRITARRAVARLVAVITTARLLTETTTLEQALRESRHGPSQRVPRHPRQRDQRSRKDRAPSRNGPSLHRPRAAGRPRGGGDSPRADTG